MNPHMLEMYEDRALSVAAGTQKPSVTGHFPSYLCPNRGGCLSICHVRVFSRFSRV